MAVERTAIWRAEKNYLAEGRERWTWQLLAEEAKKTPDLETIHRESIRLILKKRM